MDVWGLVSEQLPDYRIASVVRYGEGLDNLAYLVNDELLVRFAKHAEPGSVEREARLLAVVAEISPVPVPVPVFVVPEHDCLAYRLLPGTPLLDLPSADGPAVAGVLGRVLAALHAVPPDRFRGLVERDTPPLTEWRAEAAELYPAVADQIPQLHRPAVERFLDTPPPADEYRPVFSHNDLGIEHVLIDPATGAVTGIIDWSDAAIVDPAYDFGLIYRDLGPAALDTAIGAYRIATDPGLPDRAAFYARCSVLEDLAYGLETARHRYADKSLTALAWLFPG